MIEVTRADPASPEAQVLLKALWEYHQERTPVEGQFWLGTEELAAEGVSFYLARLDGTTVGCAAYSNPQSELKSMFVAIDARGCGVAEKLLEHVEAEAKSNGILRLETGPTHYAAIAFYTKSGFTPCDRFGEYAENDYSVCMSKIV